MKNIFLTSLSIALSIFATSSFAQVGIVQNNLNQPVSYTYNSKIGIGNVNFTSTNPTDLSNNFDHMVNYKFNMNQALMGGTAFYGVGYNFKFDINTANAASLIGSRYDITHLGDKGVNDARGHQIIYRLHNTSGSNGEISNLYSRFIIGAPGAKAQNVFMYNSVVTENASGTIDTLCHYRVDYTNTLNSTMKNVYGLYLDKFRGSIPSNLFALYSPDANAKSYHAGNFVIGNAVVAGQETPAATLHVQGEQPSFLLRATSAQAADTRFVLGVANAQHAFNYQTQIGDAVIRNLSSNNKNLVISNQSDGNLVFATGNANNNTRMMIDKNGRVFINYTNLAKANDYHLAVGGKVICEEVKVQLKDEWPDFVFDKDYHLPSLEDTKLFIQKNNHLPGVPSALEVAKEGVNVGEMEAILLKKVEEMTLLMIQLNERIKDLESKVVNQ